MHDEHRDPMIAWDVKTTQQQDLGMGAMSCADPSVWNALVVLVI